MNKLLLREVCHGALKDLGVVAADCMLLNGAEVHVDHGLIGRSLSHELDLPELWEVCVLLFDNFHVLFLGPINTFSSIIFDRLVVLALHFFIAVAVGGSSVLPSHPPADHD